MALFIVTMLVAAFYFLVLDRSEFRERFFAWSARTFGTEAGCCTYADVKIVHGKPSATTLHSATISCACIESSLFLFHFSLPTAAKSQLVGRPFGTISRAASRHRHILGALSRARASVVLDCRYG